VVGEQLPYALKPGLVGEAGQEVKAEDTAARWGSGLVDAFATPALVALVERASVSAIEMLLGADQTTVGIEVNVRHLAATPIGMKVKARSELVEIDGGRVKFKVEAWDAKEKICEGSHVRAIVDKSRFVSRLMLKAGHVNQGSDDLR
jgi:fluoroacetyl-CoA thioesterase